MKAGQAFAYFVVPLAVAYLGWKSQSSAAEIGARKDLIQTAAQILKEPRRAEDSDIRKWALEIINKNSDVPMPKEAADQLSVPLGSLLNSSPFLQLAMQKRPACPMLNLNSIPESQRGAVKELQNLCKRNAQDLFWMQVFAGMMPRTKEEVLRQEKEAKELSKSFGR